MPEEFTDAEFQAWGDSAEWRNIIVPFLQARMGEHQRQFMLVDVRDTAAVGVLQGQIHELDTIINWPNYYFDKRQLREREHQDEEEDRVAGGEVRRYLHYRR